MKWYLKFWWCNMQGYRWERIAKARRRQMVRAELNRDAWRRDWNSMKRSLTDWE